MYTRALIVIKKLHRSKYICIKISNIFIYLIKMMYKQTQKIIIKTKSQNRMFIYEYIIISTL